MDKRVAITLKYHAQSKHHKHNYAKGPPTLDFSTQPVPFSRYTGSTVLPLPLLGSFPTSSLQDLYERAICEPAPFTKANVAALLELSLGLSAWKSFNGSTWALRVNPSSGNLHPTEAHLLLASPEKNGTAEKERFIPGGLYHYAPYIHSLERRLTLEAGLNIDFNRALNGNGLLLGLTTIHWREAWKYGVRAWRYCSLDIGHAIGSISFAASLLGWQATYLKTLPDKTAASLFGLDRTEWHEHESEVPELVLHIHPCPKTKKSTTYKEPDLNGLREKLARLGLTGNPERLSGCHILWEGIEEVDNATKKVTVKGTAKETTETAPYAKYPEYHKSGTPESNRSAAEQIRLRRSAQAFDPFIGIDSESLFAMLDRTLPRFGQPPFDALGALPKINLLLFIHRVGGLPSGLYILVRNPDDFNGLKEACPTGLWRRVDQAPDRLGLYLLKEGDYRAKAREFSCMQDIAGDSAFSLGMLARVKERVTEEPHAYRRLFWEAGAIGQVLYLEATSIGMSGTGIGCFHDDSVLEAAGFSNTFNSIYHFTVGRAIEDERLQTIAPYAHLKQK